MFWEVISTNDQNTLNQLLRQNWEPYAVTTAQVDKVTVVTFYLKRLRSEVSK